MQTVLFLAFVGLALAGGSAVTTEVPSGDLLEQFSEPLWVLVEPVFSVVENLTVAERQQLSQILSADNATDLQSQIQSFVGNLSAPLQNLYQEAADLGDQLNSANTSLSADAESLLSNLTSILDNNMMDEVLALLESASESSVEELNSAVEGILPADLSNPLGGLLGDSQSSTAVPAIGGGLSGIFGNLPSL